MKLLKHFGLVVLSSLLAIGVATAQDNSGATPGSIKIGPMTGNNVSVVNPNTGEVTQLAEGDVITAPLTIVTDGESSVLLVFSNGATVEVLPGSRVEVPLFNQAPFDPTLGSFLDLQADPSPSHAMVNVVSGSVAAVVPPLNSGSTFYVSTPTGGADLNDAIAVVDYNSQTGNTEIANVRGSVSYTDATGTSTPLPAGQTLNVAGQIDPVTGAASATGTTSVTPNSPQTIAKAQTAQQATTQAASQQTSAATPAPTTPVTPVDPGLIDPSTTIPE